MADSGSSPTFVEGPRAARITADDHGAVLSIVAWYCAVVMVLAVGTRMLIKVFRTLGHDDPPILVSLVLAVGYIIAVSEQVIAGFGRREFLLSSAQIIRIQRSGFAADMLFVPTILAAKLSGLLFIHQLLVTQSHVRITKIVAALTCLWGITGVFVVGLQCGLKPVWSVGGGKCINITDFWMVWEAMNIVIDAIMIALPTHVVAQVQMNRDKKVVVILAFSFRVLAIAASAARIYYLRLNSALPSYAFSALSISLSTVVEVTLNIVAACVPFMKAFMDAFDSGRLGIAPRSTIASRGASYHLRSVLSSHSGQNSRKNKLRGDQVTHESVIASVPGTMRGVKSDRHGAERSSAGDSRESLGSDKMIIQQTMAWTVQYEGHHDNDGRLHSGDAKRFSGTSSNVIALQPEITPA